jgi:AraC-like DNA-binding protein
MNPRQGGIVSTGYLSSINFPIEHGRLRRTIRAMKGTPDQLNLNQPLLMGAPCGAASPCDGGLFAFFSFLEMLLQQSRWIGNSLGLDEQLYRLVALALFQSQGLMADMQKRWLAGPPRRNTLDPLVDYIRAHAHCNLTLTDLEEQSHYSARQLQYLFRERFDCTPMQFVRRQRLDLAREQLETADASASVTSIARASGYRSTSHFCTDFTRAYALNPSVLLRASRPRLEFPTFPPPRALGELDPPRPTAQPRPADSPTFAFGLAPA